MLRRGLGTERAPRGHLGMLGRRGGLRPGSWSTSITSGCRGEGRGERGDGIRAMPAHHWTDAVACFPVRGDVIQDRCPHQQPLTGEPDGQTFCPRRANQCEVYRLKNMGLPPPPPSPTHCRGGGVSLSSFRPLRLTHATEHRRQRITFIIMSVPGILWVRWWDGGRYLPQP